MSKKIPLTSNDLEEIFNSNIAEYGFRDTAEKNQREEATGTEETYRTNIRRQRDKILYTGGFRRLQDKTQVISATISGDHRTRLTHTLEVEQIAVSIANALRLNADLVSAIALGHDIGHTPFGHAAERKLDELLKDKGGFHHPIQSVKYIWEKYGSKIDQNIYEGILLHDSDMFEIDENEAEKQLNYLKEVDGEEKSFQEWIKIDGWLNNFPGTLEAQTVIWSDKIAYITHDLEDFLRSLSYINLQKNDANTENRLCKILNKLTKDKEIEALKDFELRDLIRNIISDLIKSSAGNINKINKCDKTILWDVKGETKKRSIKYKEDSNKKKYLNSLIINFSHECREAYYSLREFLDEHYIFSPEVQKSDAKAQVVVEWLFNILKTNYKLMPLNVRSEVDKSIILEVQKNLSLKNIFNKLQKNNQNIVYLERKIKEQKEDKQNEYNEIKEKVVSRKVATYIATMSDSYAEGMYRNLIGSKVDFII